MENNNYFTVLFISFIGKYLDNNIHYQPKVKNLIYKKISKNMYLI